ncbi:MAG: hypothetical protein KatS3mg105_3570 [Gemmatales bacterium]|nr:MAG: hypothetical protein KatS3mg105_3570 [Gemmatales bacterium]
MSNSAPSASWRRAGPEKVVDCVPDLISCLREEDADLQVKAMTTLGMVGSRAKDAVPILDNILQTNKKETRLAAITTLGKIGPEAAVAVPSLILAFEEVETLEPAVDAVARIGKPAVSHLIFALQNPSPRTRYAAALALGRIGPDAKAAIQPLAAIYSRDRFPQVRQAASRALNLIQRKN